MFHLTWICLAADFLWSAVSWSWYARSGLLVVRLRRPGDAPIERSLPNVRGLSTASDGSLAFKDLGGNLYAFRRGHRQGPGLLQGLVRFDPGSGSFEVQGRVSLPFLGFVSCVAGLAIRTWNPGDGGLLAVLVLAPLIFGAFLTRDVFVCRKVGDVVASLWR